MWIPLQGFSTTIKMEISEQKDENMECLWTRAHRTHTKCLKNNKVTKTAGMLSQGSTLMSKLTLFLKTTKNLKCHRSICQQEPIKTIFSSSLKATPILPSLSSRNSEIFTLLHSLSNTCSNPIPPFNFSWIKKSIKHIKLLSSTVIGLSMFFRYRAIDIC